MLLAVVIPSPGVWVDGGELGEGPTVFPVPVLFAAPEEECCFLFLEFCNQKQKANDTSLLIENVAAGIL